jgi:HAMP domain-containing protein
MTVTKKVGSLLLLLTAGSLAGIVAFAFFLSNTAGDGLYLIAALLEQSTLQQLQIQTLRVRDGQDEARDSQGRLIEAYDMLITTMKDGGLHPVRPNTLLSSMPSVGSDLALEAVIRAMHEDFPKPSAELERRITPAYQLWLEIRKPLQTIGQKPRDDPEARGAYDMIKPRLDSLDQASRLITLEATDRIIAARGKMFVTLASIAGLSVALFFVGLWFSKRYISHPIELIENTARLIRAGDFAQRVPIISSDEVASLAMTLNDMCAEVERSV